MKTRILKLADNLWLNFAFVLACIFLLKARPVPDVNEFVYLLLPVRQWDPSFLQNDWTFAVPWSSHLVFNVTAGLFTRVWPLEAVGWAGRAACWSLITLALLRIGRLLRIPLWAASLAIVLWLVRNQSLVAFEWIIGGFEAKTVAYIFLLWGLDWFLQEKDNRAAAFFGLAFSFHPVVGFWGGLAAGCALLALKYPWKKLAAAAGLMALSALPGALPLLMSGEGRGIPPDGLRFYVLTSMPFHLDPFSWSPPAIALLYALLALSWLFVRKDEDRAVRFLFFFQLALGGFFTLGLLARAAENYSALLIMPCRLFPVLTPLFFLFHLARAYRYRLTPGLKRFVQVAGVLALFSLHPAGTFYWQAKLTYRSWHPRPDGARDAFRWLAENTPNGTIVILPPWRRDTFYLSRRAQIANWNAPAVDRLAEWRARIEAMTGQTPKPGAPPNPVVSIPRLEDALARLENEYDHLTEEDIAALVARYGGEYLVSETAYGYPAAFASGAYKVYALKK